MHAIFIPYGIKYAVEHLIADMTAQKFQMPVKNGKKITHIWVQGSVRLCPFGVIDYVFPKENMDAVLNTLNFGDKSNHYLSRPYLAMLRKALKCNAPPKIKTDKKMLWIKENVSIIPVGIKEDRDLTEKQGQYKGWTHEAL